MDQPIRAIQTSYGGVEFRSRLEARWAVFFDALQLRWEYEPQGYQLSDGDYYLPDFWLPDLKTWYEVKGKQPTEWELERLRLLAVGTGERAALAWGGFNWRAWTPEQVDTYWSAGAPRGWPDHSAHLDDAINSMYVCWPQQRDQLIGRCGWKWCMKCDYVTIVSRSYFEEVWGPKTCSSCGSVGPDRRGSDQGNYMWFEDIGWHNMSLRTRRSTGRAAARLAAAHEAARTRKF